MKRILTMAGAVLALALTASASSAASLPSLAQPQGTTLESGLIQVHGVHRSCELGYRGWHRSMPWGERVWCRPHVRHFQHHGWKRHHGWRRGHDGYRGRQGSHDGGDRGGRGGDHDGRGHRSNFEPSQDNTRAGSYDL